MGERLVPKGAFDIPDVPDYIPRKLKPWIFIVFVLIIQFSGGIYLAAASQLVGDKALMQEDILMAGYASLIGLSLNFAVMFRIKFRYSNRIQLLAACAVLLGANILCTVSDCVPLLVGACFIAGWFRMQATLAINSTIQLWITPCRDMAVFFCYVYIIVDGMIQLSGMAAIYADFFYSWEYMQWIVCGLLLLMMVAVIILVKPIHGPMYIPLLGIDWIGSLLWGIFMLCFAFVCVYGNYFDWWEAPEITGAAALGIAVLGLNLWRASFLHHPYISFRAMTNHNVIRAMIVYAVFYTLLATEHVFEHSYAAAVLGFDDTNLIDLNWYVLAGIACGTVFTYFAFARYRCRYKTMTVVAFILAAGYLAWFYFCIGRGVEKEALFIPLFMRGMASVIISIVYLTSIVQSGLPFMVFPQALVINGFGGAVMGATLGPAILGELFRHTMAKNAALLGSGLTAFNPEAAHIPVGELYGMVQVQSLIVSMKEIYGLLLMIALLCIFVLGVSYSPLRPFAIFPKWSTVRRTIRHLARIAATEKD